MKPIEKVAHAFEYRGTEHEPIGVGPDGMPLDWEESDRWTCTGCGLKVLSVIPEWFDERDGKWETFPGSSDPRYDVLRNDETPNSCPEGIVLQVMEA